MKIIIDLLERLNYGILTMAAVWIQTLDATEMPIKN